MADTIGWVTYVDDENDNLSIKMSEGNADAQLETLSPVPTVGSHWPFGHHNLRHVTGKSADTGDYGRLVICDPTGPIWQRTDTTWTNSFTGVTYTILGQFGERKPLNEIS
jgi:hypothetical protein